MALHGLRHPLLANMSRPWVEGLPVIATGLFMGYIGDFHVTLLHERLTATAYARFLVELDRCLALVPSDVRVATLLHTRSGDWWNGLTLRERTGYLHQYSQVVTNHRETVRRNVVGTGVVVASMMSRISVRTVIAILPSIVPITIAPTAAAAIRIVTRAFRGKVTPPETMTAAYGELLAAHSPGLLESSGLMK